MQNGCLIIVRGNSERTNLDEIDNRIGRRYRTTLSRLPRLTLYLKPPQRAVYVTRYTRESASGRIADRLRNGTERSGAVSTVVLRELMSGPLRADIMVSFGKPARSSRCAGSKQGQRAAGGRTPLDGRHLDRPEPAISISLFLSRSLRIEIYILCIRIHRYTCIRMCAYICTSTHQGSLLGQSFGLPSKGRAASRTTRPIDRSRN